MPRWSWNFLTIFDAIKLNNFVVLTAKRHSARSEIAHIFFQQTEFSLNLKLAGFVFHAFLQQVQRVHKSYPLYGEA